MGGTNGNPKEPLTCPKCGKEIKPEDEYHKKGRIKEGVSLGNGVDLGFNVVKEHYGNTFSNHPFYLKDKTITSKDDRNGIEAHHLVSSASFKQDIAYQRLARFLGYNINHWKNGVLLPKVMMVACHYGVPLHKGGHGATFIKKEAGTQNDTHASVTDGIAGWTDLINQNKDGEVIFPVYDKANELTNLKYENHLNTLVEKVCRTYIEEEEICTKSVEEIEELAVDFVNDVDDLSQAVFRELISFSWTLTSDGFDYTPGGIGCCSKNYLYEKRNLIKSKIQNLPDAARDMMSAIYSSPEKAEEVKEKLEDKICRAGSQGHSKIITNNNRAYFIERKSIPPFKLED